MAAEPLREITLRLSEAEYAAVRERAQDQAVEEYILQVLKEDFDDAEELGRIFTPELIAHLDLASAEAQKDGVQTWDEFEDEFKNFRRQWREKHSA